MINPRFARSGGLAACGILVATLAFVAAGCGNKDKESADAGAPVRGEPIRGEPIVAKAPVATPAVAPAAIPGEATAPVTAAKESPPTAASSATGAALTGNSPATATALATTVAAASSLAASPAPVAVGAGESGAGAGPLSIGFDKLASFQYTLPDGPVDTNVVAQSQASNQIPDPIKLLNNRQVSIKGFMLPLKVEKGLVTELLIMRDQSMCCYGTVPRINEWVSVKMVSTGVKPIMDQAVTLFGKLKVGEMYENGYLVGIYALDGERMAGPLDM